MSTRTAGKRILLSFLLLLICSLTAFAQSTKSFVTVDAARYQPAVSPDSIVAGFSYSLTASEAWATQDVDSVTPGIQLPTTLNGLRVLVNNREAGLLYVGPSQINYVVPTDTEVDAPASVVVTDTQGNVVAQGTLNMAASNLSIFTNNQTGTGSPSALVTADGITYTPINNGDGTTNNVPPGQYLVLFGTGVRAGQDVKAFIGGIEAPVEYAGSQQWYVGLDQINIRVPDSLAGQGWLEVVVTDGAVSSNSVLINVGGNPTAAAGAPVITGFGVSEATAGQVVSLTGSNFPTNLSEASVKVGSTPGQVVSTSATGMTFVVPFGAATGYIVAGNASGTRQSSAQLKIATSISGTVLNSQDAPVAGVPVSINGTGLATVTDASGRFLLAGAPRGVVQLTFDASSQPAGLGLSNVNISTIVTDGRDNELGFSVYLPSATGTSMTLNSVNSGGGYASQTGVEAAPVVIESDGLKLEIPGVVTFPDGKTTGKIGLTRLPVDGRLPSVLPAGVYPSVAALITPMGTTFGAKGEGLATLTFPNPDKLPAGSSVDLYAYRPNVAPSAFVKKGTATVSEAGDVIVAKTLIDVATVWFVALPNDQSLLTTVVGRVLDSGDKPVAKARVFVHGRSAVTDADGKFEVKNVRTKNGDDLTVDALFFNPAGVSLKAGKSVKAVVPGVTDAGDIKFPAPPPLTILIRPAEVKTSPGVDVDLKLTISKPLSATATINLTGPNGAGFVITPNVISLPAGSTEATFKVKNDKVSKGAITASLAANVDDATPDNTRKGVAVVYVLPPPPVIDSINPATGAPGSTFAVTGKGLNPYPQGNAVFFQQGDRIFPVDLKTLKIDNPSIDPQATMTLSGMVPGMTAGNTDVFVTTFREGVPVGTSNKVKFVVTVPAAPQLASITPSSGLPGATFTLVGAGLDPDPKRNGIVFKQGDKLYPVSPDLLKVIPNVNTASSSITLQGQVPRMPAGDAEVFAVVLRDGAPSSKSNSLAFKVLSPAGATLNSIDPKEGPTGTTFNITGSGFDPDPKRNFLFFKQGDRIIQLDPATIKTDGKTFISSSVPRIVAGDYEVFVLTNLDSVQAVAGKLPGTPSNSLVFKVLPPPAAKLDSIDPTQGRPGVAFTLKGSGFDSDPGRNHVFFKQNDRFLMLDPLKVKVSATAITGVVPDLPAGDYEVLVTTNLDLVPGTIGVVSNSLKFTILPPPAPALETISPTQGAPGTAFKISGKNFPAQLAVVFKQGDKSVTLLPAILKISETSVEGILPALPPGAAEVLITFGASDKSNSLPFKFIAPPNPAVLKTINPTEITPGKSFKLSGDNLAPFYGVFFVQNNVVIPVLPEFFKMTLDGGIEGIVPKLAAGDAQVFVGYGDANNSVMSNKLSVKVVVP